MESTSDKEEKIGVDQKPGNPIVHMRADSDSEMQALFDCVLKPSSQIPLQKPFKMRNLPASFFTPPAHRQSPAPTVTHSREGSSDSTYGGTSAPGGGSGTNSNSGSRRGAMSPGPQHPQHFRHHSSPASLQQTLSLSLAQHNHAKQHSYDALADDLNALPPGWEQARTQQGQVYFIK